MQLRCKRKIYEEKYRMFAGDSQTLRNQCHFVTSVIASNVFYCMYLSTTKFHKILLSSFRGVVLTNCFSSIFILVKFLGHLIDSGDLLLWVGVRRRPSCVNIFFSRTTGPILIKFGV